MYRHRIASRSALTVVELVVIIGLIALMIALLLPATETAREAARRCQCISNLKQIGLALQSYEVVNKAFPPGLICTTAPVQPANQYDVWGEAAKTDPGFAGTSWLLPTLRFLEAEGNNTWKMQYSVAGGGNETIASMDVERFYCPTRRNGLRPGDSVMMLSSTWTGGGTDYGGCAGRHAAFTLQTGYNLCDASMYYDPNFFPTPFKDKKDDTPEKRWGIFGRVNVSTKNDEIADGTSNTLIIGELQRITNITPGSKDGWAVGGPATLFTTGAMIGPHDGTLTEVSKPGEGFLFNNGFWGSPGSEHSGGANFGMADGSVRFLSTSIDPNIFAILGSMADGGPEGQWSD
jgi:prepilin-type processing-associated H-X9-DG protein